MIMGGILSVAAAGRVYRYLARHHDKRLPLSARQRAVHLNGSVNINKPAEEIYQFWRRFVDLPKVMTFLERVENKGGDVTHWVARGPLATRVQWDSEVTEDVPNGRIAWHSLEGSDVKTWGDVKFVAKSHGSGDRKSTRLNSSHVAISYAVFCLKKQMGIKDDIMTETDIRSDEAQ